MPDTARPISGQVVFVTGAARGIGAAAAKQLAARGAKLALVGLEPDELQQVAAACGPNAAWFEADVTDGSSASTSAWRTTRGSTPTWCATPTRGRGSAACASASAGRCRSRAGAACGDRAGRSGRRERAGRRAGGAADSAARSAGTTSG
jgi:hypothetical protein